MSVDQGALMVKGDLDSLAAVANSKTSLASKPNAPYAFSSSGWKTELSKLRADIFSVINTSGGYSPDALVSGPWVLVPSSAPGVCIGVTAGPVGQVGNTWAAPEPYSQAWVGPHYQAAGFAAYKFGALLIRAANDNPVAGDTSYIFPLGQTPSVKLGVFHGIYLSGGVTAGDSISFTASIPTSQSSGTPVLQGLFIFGIFGVSEPAYSFSGSGAAAVVSSSIAPVSGGGGLVPNWIVTAIVDGQVTAGSTFTLTITLPGGYTAQWNYTAKLWWLHEEADEGSATGTPAVFGGGCGILPITIDLTVASQVEITVIPFQGFATGLMVCMLPPVAGTGIYPFACSSWMWNLATAEDAAGLVSAQSYLASVAVNVNGGVAPWGIVPGTRSRSPGNFTSVNVAVPGSVTGTATFTRYPHNNSPGTLETITCPYYKIDLGITHGQMLEYVQGANDGTAPTTMEWSYFQESGANIDGTTIQLPGDLPLCEGTSVEFNPDFLDARVMSRDGTMFWWQTAYLGYKNASWRGFRQWFIACDPDTDEAYLFLLLDTRSTPEAGSDVFGITELPGDTIVGGAIVSACGMSRTFHEGSTLLTVVNMGPAGNLYNPGNNFAVFNGGTQVPWYEMTINTTFFPASATFTSGSYAKGIAAFMASTLTNGVARNWMEFVQPWSLWDLNVSPTGMPTGGIPWWTVGLSQGGQWQPGQLLTVSLSTKMNLCNTIDYKAALLPLTHWWANTLSTFDDGIERAVTPIGSSVWEAQVNRSASRKELLMAQADGTLQLTYEPVSGGQAGANLKLYFVQTGYDIGYDQTPPAYAGYQYDAIGGALSLASYPGDPFATAERSFFWDVGGDDNSGAVILEINPAHYTLDAASGKIALHGSMSLWGNPYDQYSGGLSTADQFTQVLAVYAARPVLAFAMPAISTKLGSQDAAGNFIEFATVDIAEATARADRLYPGASDTPWPFLQPIPGSPSDYTDAGMLLIANQPIRLRLNENYTISSAPVTFPVAWPGDAYSHDFKASLFTIYNPAGDIVVKFNGGWRRVIWNTYAGWKAIDQTVQFAPTIGTSNWSNVAAAPSVSGAYLKLDYDGQPWGGQSRRQAQFFAANGGTPTAPGTPLNVDLSANKVVLTNGDGDEPDGTDLIFAFVDDFYVARHVFMAGQTTVPPRTLGLDSADGNEQMQRLFYCEPVAAWQWFDVEVQAYPVLANPVVGSALQGLPYAFQFNDTEAVLDTLS